MTVVFQLKMKVPWSSRVCIQVEVLEYEIISCTAHVEKRCFQAGSPMPYVAPLFLKWAIFTTTWCSRLKCFSFPLSCWIGSENCWKTTLGQDTDLMPLARNSGWVKSCCDCCGVGSLWVLCCLKEPFLTNTDKSRGRIYSEVLWDIQGNTARTHRWQRQWGSLKFGLKAFNHRNSDYNLYLTWICTFPCWPGASAGQSLSCLFCDILLFSFSPVLGCPS